MQISAYLATVTARRAQVFGTGRALAIAIPAAIAASSGAFWLAFAVGLGLWPREFLELRPLIFAFVSGLAAFIVLTVAFQRRLLRRPHPSGLRGVLTRVFIAGATGSVLVVLAVPMRESGPWLVVAAPTLWTVPLWLACSALRPATEHELAAARVAT